MVAEKDENVKDKKDSEKDYVERQLVVFSLGEEEFGVDIKEVNSIIKIPSITSIPNAQDFIVGVINLRGRIIVVIDLAKKIGLPSKERDKNSRIIIIETKDTMVGMIVDHSREALRISQDKIQPPPALITNKIKSDYLEGVAIVNERLLILLDLAKVLSTDEMSTVQKAQNQSPVVPKSEENKQANNSGTKSNALNEEASKSSVGEGNNLKSTEENYSDKGG